MDKKNAAICQYEFENYINKMLIDSCGRETLKKEDKRINCLFYSYEQYSKTIDIIFNYYELMRAAIVRIKNGLTSKSPRDSMYIAKLLCSVIREANRYTDPIMIKDTIAYFFMRIQYVPDNITDNMDCYLIGRATCFCVNNNIITEKTFVYIRKKFGKEIPNFNWPSTMLAGTGYYAEDFREKGILRYVKYTVGKYSNVSSSQRRRILKDIIDGKISHIENELKKIYGPPCGRDRLLGISRLISACCKRAKGQSADYGKAIMDWESDLNYIKRFYVDKYDAFDRNKNKRTF